MIVLGVDCGTQGTKTVALDGESGEIVADAARHYDVLPGLPAGHMEQEPQTWMDALDGTVTEVCAKLGDRKAEIMALGVSGQQHGFVPLDAAGEVIRPAKLWCDTATTEECARIEEAFGGVTGLVAKTGNGIPAGFTASKILWLKRREPDHFKRLATVLLPHDYLNYRLTGSARMEFGDASGTALMDVRTRSWCREIADFIDPGLMDKLPPLHSSREPVGTVGEDWLKRWGLRGDVVVSAGGGDNMMGAIGTGNVRPGRVTASLGTSGTIYAFSEQPVVDPQGEIAAFCDSTDGWLPLVCTMNVTVATEAARKLFGWTLDAFNEAVAQVPAGADGLIFLPYLQGERMPNLPRGRAAYLGLDLRNFTAPHLARAAMEGVTLGLAYGLRRMGELGIAPTEIRVTGGGAKSAVWRQVCADVFGCRVTVPRHSEGAATGAAIQALGAVRSERSIAEWADALATIDPERSAEPSRAFDYGGLLERHTAIMQSLRAGGHL